MAAQAEVPLRVGIALGAGSAAAMAQIGVVEMLVEAGIPRCLCAAGWRTGSDALPPSPRSKNVPSRIFGGLTALVS
jgi:hypothetical protein